jgi:hypothetical protein
MKTEVFKKKNGSYSWRTIDGENVVTDSPKEFPTEHAAQRNMLRTLRQQTQKKPHPNAIPTAKTKTKTKPQG